MKVLTILGSPKKRGKTAATLQTFEEKIISCGNEVERVHITDYKINGCLGCFACMANQNEPGCVQKDDAQLIFEKMACADVIVMASPIYRFFLSAQIKPLIDRSFCLSNTPALDGERMALLTTCAGQSEGNADLPKDVMEQKLSNVIDLYQKFSGDDPRKVPMKVYPAPHYAMGGIYVDAMHHAGVTGLYACGECDCLYHGANRLGGNSLLSATYGGFQAAMSIVVDRESGVLQQADRPYDASWIRETVSGQEREMNSYLNRSGKESTAAITEELGETLTESVGIIRRNANLKDALNKIQELKERWKRIVPEDKGNWANSSVISVRKLRPCLTLAEAIVTGTLGRNESRGAHYKPEFPKRDDQNWLKTTVAKYNDKNGQIMLNYKPIDVSILSPQSDGSTMERRG